MPVSRFRSIEDMRPMWRDPDDPENLRDVAMMMSLHLRLSPAPTPGVRRFKSIEEAKEDRGDPLRQAELQQELINLRYRDAKILGTVLAWNGEMDALPWQAVISRLSEFTVIHNTDNDMRKLLGEKG